jgi:hypothetical protein
MMLELTPRWVALEAIEEARAAIKRHFIACERNKAEAHDESHLIHLTEGERWDADNAAKKAVLLSCLYLEGTINAHGVFRLGEEFFELHLERLQPSSKIAVLLAICKQDLFAESTPTLRLVTRLFARRNQLAHAKTRELTAERIDRFNAEEAKPKELVQLAADTLASFKEFMLREDPDARLFAWDK